MKNPVAAICLLIVFSSSGQKITYSTKKIINAGYLAATDWKEIPVDAKSEDVNNPSYGGKYYPPTSANLRTTDERITIARGYMTIEALFSNKTDQHYVLQKLVLEVDDQYPISGSYEAMVWEIGDRGGDYHPFFELEAGTYRYIDLPEDYVLKPQTVAQNTLVPVDVEWYDGPEIFKFHLIAVFQSDSDPSSIIRVKSDKHYFIAPK